LAIKSTILPKHDLIHVPALTWHQFRADGSAARFPVHGERRARPAAAAIRRRSSRLREVPEIAAFIAPRTRDERGGPRRIVCLTEETTETPYLLGEQDRIVGISGFTVRPPQARREAKGVGLHQR
jgi:hypothetical protein